MSSSDSASILDRLNDYLRRSATVKLIGVGILALILLIPASMVESLVWERQRLRDRAVSEVAATWGQSQRLAGPVLQVPFTETVSTSEDGARTVRNGSAYFLPDRIDAAADVASEERYRGIYVAVLYTTGVEVRARFDSLAVAQVAEGRTLDWSRAALTFGVSDLRGIDSLSDLRLSKLSLTGAPTRVPFQPGTPSYALVEDGFQAPLALDGPPRELEVAFGLQLRGSGSLAVTPLGGVTEVALSGDWPAPKFLGAFLPDEREVTDDGFAARYEVLKVNRPFRQQGTRVGGQTGLPGSPLSSGVLAAADEVYAEAASVDYGMRRYDDLSGGPDVSAAYDFGVRFLLPVDEYRKTQRSAKYAALFVLATFLTFFFIEVLNRRRLHPVQYLLVGSAVVLFYVLLLSLSEHVGFDAAYGISVLLILGLVTAYAHSQLRSPRLTALVAGVLAVLYGFFYSLLQLEDYSLLLGSLGLLLALATIMYVTRKTDWYGLKG